MPTLAELGEFEVIRRLALGRGARDPAVVVDRGDDAAVLAPSPGRHLAITTDLFLEGRHWRPEWIAPEALGARLAIACLSDLAAMGARPRWALIASGVPGTTALDTLLAFQRGLEAALAADGAALVGGNLTATTGVSFHGLTAGGEVEPGAAWTRAGARAGDLLALTGHPGRAGAAVRLLAHAGTTDAAHAPLSDAWRAPVSRVAFALALAPLGAVRAAIDLSDGLGGDLDHLCEASGVGASLDEAALPDDPALTAAARSLECTPEALRFGPSDDYELLLAIAPEARGACEAEAARMGVPFAIVGRCIADASVRTITDRAGRERPLPRAGFDHYR